MSRSSKTLLDELQNIDDVYKKRTARHGGLGDAELVELITQAHTDPALCFPDHPLSTSLTPHGSITALDEQLGEDLIKQGKVAFLIMAGGAGTRMGGCKSFAKFPNVGLSLLGWKLLQSGEMPVWIMVSPGMLQETRDHISALSLPPNLQGTIFEQFEGYRLTPDNRLSLIDGVPDFYPLGHGDVGPALVESGVLDANPNVKYVYVCNVDNVLASPHPGILGHHARHGDKVTCEVVSRCQGDRGGCLAWVDDHLQIVEDFRLPQSFIEEAAYKNTNTMIIDVDVLRRDIKWRWHRVRKHVGSRIVVQHERLLQQYTEEHRANFVLMPRESRYLPIKGPSDLETADNVVNASRFR